MKKGKLVLGTAAFIVTAVGAFAFRTHKTSARIFGMDFRGHCLISTCFTNNSIALSGSLPCHTIHGVALRAGSGAGTYWKATKGGANLGVCTQPTLHWTHTN
jgi:hypothetical protein